VSFTERPAVFDGFVRAQNARLVDGMGNPLLLRGVGLGNWMLPEGYMWKFGPGAESPREIEGLVTRLVGSEAASAFWHRFFETFITEADIERIAQSGFDHVRLPINSRLIQTEDGEPIEAGLVMIDRLIEWCRKHRLWVLLDLHGAPGGQTGTNIDDSQNNKPELFMVERYRRNTSALWRTLAARYVNETVVLGYDLLNEPLPNEWQHIYATELVGIYRELTTAIREIDQNHLIVYEGSHWATNWDIFTEVWDDNSVLQFHKYWSPPDVATIQKFLDVRDRLGLPIYMGEGGENNFEWLYAAFRLYEAHDIGWNFWPWKKIDTRTSPASITPPAGWSDIVEFVAGGVAVSPESAQATLDQLLVNSRIENCVWQPEIVHALLADRPSIMPGWGFGYRGKGESYSTIAATPLPGMREDDEVTIQYAMVSDRDGHNFEQTDGRDHTASERMVVNLLPGDWLEYEITGVIDLDDIRILDAGGARALVKVDRTERGIRATATAQTTIATVQLTIPNE
jgi:endoglucanase